MSMSTSEILEAAVALPPKDRLYLIEHIWASLEPDDEDDLEIPEEHARILDERLARYDREGPSGAPWEEVKARLLKKL